MPTGIVAHLCQAAMALKSTIFKVNLGVADLDRNYYGDHRLTLTRHPSETDERMMIRLLAFALNADERLEFGRGLSTGDEPALWLKGYDGTIECWIDVGMPDESAVRRAAGRAERVLVYAYGGRAADAWWARDGVAIMDLAKVEVLFLDPQETAALAAMAKRNMDLQFTIQEGQVLVVDGERAISLGLRQYERP